MKKQSTKIGVIGGGGRIRKIIKLLLEENPSLEIKSLHDPSNKSIKKWKDELKLTPSIEKNYKEITEDKEIDWVFIGSINSAHKEQILSALKNQKDIFSEKPLAINFKELLKIKKEFDRRRKKFIISYPLRHSPHYKKIKEIINEGKIGEIISLEFNEVLTFEHGSLIMGDWRRFEKFSGGHLLEKCCHDMDLVNWMLGDKAEKVVSFGGNNFFIPKNKEIFEKIVNKKKKFKRGDTKNPFTINKDVMDNQVVLIEYSKGARATFHTNTSSGIPERRMYFCGTKGTLRADLITGKIEVRDLDRKKIEEHLNEEIKGGHGGGDQYLAKEINKAIKTDYRRKNDLNEAIISSATAILADKSRKNKEIINLKKYWKQLGYN